jgi:hypothetical protein
MSGQELVEDLIIEVKKIQVYTQSIIEPMTIEHLMLRPDPKCWSVLECVEHMNLSSGHYISRLEKLIPKLEINAKVTAGYDFKPGFLGEKFSVGILPKEDGTVSSTMKTFFFFEPKKAAIKKHKSLEEFIQMNNTMLEMLEKARAINLNKGRVTSTLGPWLRFKTGDAFRFSIAHNRRHMVQVERIIACL